jgi:hypothetical protein
MKSLHPLLCGLLLAGLFPAAAVLAAEAPPQAPEALQVPPGHVLKLAVKAEGFQIYECGADKNNPAAFAWNLTGPQADLFDAQGKKIGKHYAGPTWESLDGSKVVGKVKASDKGPDANAVAWLLLDAKSTGGSGVLSSITHVQRLATVGGKAPADGCTAQTKDAVTSMPYSANYYFYEAAK